MEANGTLFEALFPHIPPSNPITALRQASGFVIVVCLLKSRNSIYLRQKRKSGF